MTEPIEVIREALTFYAEREDHQYDAETQETIDSGLGQPGLVRRDAGNALEALARLISFTRGVASIRDGCCGESTDPLAWCIHDEARGLL